MGRLLKRRLFLSLSLAPHRFGLRHRSIDIYCALIGKNPNCEDSFATSVKRLRGKIGTSAITREPTSVVQRERSLVADVDDSLLGQKLTFDN